MVQWWFSERIKQGTEPNDLKRHSDDHSSNHNSGQNTTNNSIYRSRISPESTRIFRNENILLWTLWITMVETVFHKSFSLVVSRLKVLMIFLECRFFHARANLEISYKCCLNPFFIAFFMLFFRKHAKRGREKSTSAKNVQKSSDAKQQRKRSIWQKRFRPS